MLTEPQRKHLQLAVDDGVLMLGGLDGHPGAKRRVINTLLDRGLIEWTAGLSRHSEHYKITEAGREALRDI